MNFVTLKKPTAFAIFICFLSVVAIIFGLSVNGIVTAVNKGNRKLPIYSVETSEKRVAITFDCAWGVDYTDKLLSIMEEKQVVSTFFMVEFWAKTNAEYVKKIDEKGHAIGTHSTTHSYMSKLSKEKIEEELVSSSNAITAITGKTVELFRAPYGDYNNTLIETAESLNLFTIQWDVDSHDWMDKSSEYIKDRILSRVKEGSIVLFHNNGLHTADALPYIIDELKSRGFTFVTVSDLIYRENYRIDVNGKQIQNN